MRDVVSNADRPLMGLRDRHGNVENWAQSGHCFECREAARKRCVSFGVARLNYGSCDERNSDIASRQS